MRRLALTVFAVLLSCAVPFEPVDDRLVGSWASGDTTMELRADQDCIIEQDAHSWSGEWTRPRYDFLAIYLYRQDGELLNEAQVIDEPYEVTETVLIYGQRHYERIQ